MKLSRRDFLAACTAASAGVSTATTTLMKSQPARINSKFQVSVLTDEVDADLEKACQFAADEFGLRYVELRKLWGKSIVDMKEPDLARAKDILRKYNLQVTAIAGPLFKTDWPGAPISEHSKRKTPAGKEIFEEQEKILNRQIELAAMFETRHIRCFDFWQLKDSKPYTDQIRDKLRDAAAKAQKAGLVIVMENEPACNSSTAAVAAETYKAVNHPAFKLIWDPGNSLFAGETPYPDAYELLPRGSIAHVHIKDGVTKDGKHEWECVGRGQIKYVEQFKALKRDGYAGPVVLETHWKGTGNKEEASRQCLRGMISALREAGAVS